MPYLGSKAVMRIILVFCLLFVLFQPQTIIAQSIASYPQPSRTWGFIENKGQLTQENQLPDNDILYYGSFRNATVYVTKNSVRFVFQEAINHYRGDIPDQYPYLIKPFQHKPSVIKTARMDMQFSGADPRLVINPELPEKGTINDYSTHFPEGITGIKTFEKLVYQNIYPQINLILFADTAGLRYEFELKPGARIADIAIQWLGVDTFQSLENNGFRFVNSLETIQESGLKGCLWDGTSTSIHYETSDNNTIRFSADAYDTSKTMLIDPELSWATWYGGTNQEGWNVNSMCDVATDPNNNVVLAYNTASSSGIATSGSYQSTLQGQYNDFVAKFDKNGSLLWASYFGAGKEDGSRVAIDPSGNIYLAGETNDVSGIATKGAYQTSLSGSMDAFVAKFSPDGKLIWSTYFGGDSLDYGLGLKTDPRGNVFLAGWTFSNKGLATNGSFQSKYTGNGQAFLAKFNAAGNLKWATYFGGNAQNEGLCLAADSKGNALLGGLTNSSGLATTGAHQSSYAGGFADAFLVQFDSLGHRNWCTYYGDTVYEYALALATDRNDNVLMAGVTNSPQGIASSGTHQQTYMGGPNDAFLAKFSSTGSYIWGTYYGGTKSDQAAGLATDSCNFIYMTGFTQSDSGIATADGYQFNNIPHGTHAYLAKFSPSGQLAYGSYFEGNNRDVGYAVAVDGYNDVYLGGQTNSSSGIATSSGYQTHIGGNSDAFLAKFLPGNPIVISGSALQVNCQGDTISLGRPAISGATYQWASLPKGFASTIADPRVQPIRNTIYSVRVNYPGGCAFYDTVMVSVTHLFNNISMVKTTGICPGQSVQIGGVGKTGYAYQWTNSTKNFSDSVPDPVVSPPISTSYFILETNDTTGCTYKDTETVIVHPLPHPIAGSAQIFCAGSPNIIGYIGPPKDTYSWISVPPGFSSSVSNPTVRPLVDTKYILTETTPFGCSASDSLTIHVDSVPADPHFKKTDTICPGNSFHRQFSPRNGETWSWSSNPPGFSSSDSEITVFPTTTTKYILFQYNKKGTCARQDTFRISVIAPKINWNIQRDTGQTIEYAANDTSFISEIWRFGDSSQSTTAAGAHHYASAGNFVLSLKIVTSRGCLGEKDTLLPISFLFPRDSIYLFPNPFTDHLSIGYILSQNGHIQALLYDDAGRLIGTLLDKTEIAGLYRVTLIDTEENLPPAIYYLQVFINGKAKTFKLLKTD